MLVALLSVLAASALASPDAGTSSSGNYAPVLEACPVDHTFIRPANGLHPGEVEWRENRVHKVIPALEEYLNRNPIPDFDVDCYIRDLKNNTSVAPVLAFTFSGGGWRSTYPGLGLYEALDGRVAKSREAGTGGLYQAMTYHAGLSGGTLGTAPLAIMGFPPLAELIDRQALNGSTNSTSYKELAYKVAAGFNISAADFLGAQTVPDTLINNRGIDPMSYTWSGIQESSRFVDASEPFPLVVVTEVIPPGLTGSVSYQAEGPYDNGTILLVSSDTLTVFEFTPFEWGSWVGRVPGFADIRYLGTTFVDGKPIDKCVQGYDTAVWLIGTCADSFNAWTAQAESGGGAGQFTRRSLPGETTVPYPLNYSAVVSQARVDSVLDVVAYVPYLTREVFKENPADYFYAKVANPFYKYAGVDAEAASQEQLWLVDAGQGFQESPFFPLIQPARGVDLIIVSDACGSELPNGWMNGSSIINSARLAKMAKLPFPTVPTSPKTFLNLGYTSQPVFFGCHDPIDVPLMLFVADYPYSTYSNISALSNDGRTVEQVRMLTENTLPNLSQQGFREHWNECLACGAIYRSLQRMHYDLPARCVECMQEYCWNGIEVEKEPGLLEPSLVLQPNLSWSEWNAAVYN